MYACALINFPMSLLDRQRSALESLQQIFVCTAHSPTVHAPDNAAPQYRCVSATRNSVRDVGVAHSPLRPTSSMLKEAQAVAPESTHEGLPKKVLVAEDNVVSQQVAKHYLEAIGCNVLVVEDGHASVAAGAGPEFGPVLRGLS